MGINSNYSSPKLAFGAHIEFASITAREGQALLEDFVRHERHKKAEEELPDIEQKGSQIKKEIHNNLMLPSLTIPASININAIGANTPFLNPMIVKMKEVCYINPEATKKKLYNSLNFFA